MISILEYAQNEQRTFDEFPFNAIDALIFAEAAYFQWEYLLPNIWTPEWPYRLSDSMFLHEMPSASDMPLFGQYAADTPKNIKLIDLLRTSHRFRNVSVSHLCAHTKASEEIQFAALCFHMPDDLCYIAFRGTDGTLIGWKEDFQLSYKYPIPSQEQASRYVNYIAQEMAPETRFCIGGHSKGGNMAVFAATECRDSIKDRITDIYSFDGPGFSFKLFETEAYKRIADRVHHIVPSASFVGMLLENAPGTRFIQNRSLWLLQHSPFTWSVGIDDFEYVPQWNHSAKKRIDAVNQWLDEKDFKEREEFTEMLYRIATSSGAGNLFHPDDSWVTRAGYIFEATRSIDAQSRARINETIKLLVLFTLRQHH